MAAKRASAWAAALATDLLELIKGGWHDMDDTKTVLLQIL